MSGISSSVGVVSGLPTEDIINQLMLIESLPLFRLQDRVAVLEAQRSAINDLLSSVLGIQTAIGQFGDLALFRHFNATSSDPTILTATPLADVWHAWTTPEGVNSFFGADAAIDWVVGGKYEIYFSLDAPVGQRGSEGCRVLSFLPGKMLSFSWNAPATFAAVRKERTQVVMLFNELAPTVTRVRLRHHGWQEGEEWDQVFDYFSRAWPSVFASFEKRFAHPEAEPTADSPGKPGPDSDPPEHLDYEMWLGPAPKKPYNAKRVHYNFRFFRDYSGGQMTNWGAHYIDIAQWGMGMDESGPVEIDGRGTYHEDGWHEVTETCRIEHTYASGVVLIVGQREKDVPGGAVLFSVRL
ncbi:MAG: SRPBCC domain-containing protein [Planctomycetes bacterium]|nr:SRPBCC domain-containing protein [Planctomycetota bacterium]